MGILMQMQCNMTGIVEHTRFESVGSGVFAEGSLANHDCAPTCQFLFRFPGEGHRPTLQLQCTRDLNLGENLTISYGDMARPVWERRRQLQASHWFSCKCAKCMEDLTAAGLLRQVQMVGNSHGELLYALFERTLPDEAEATKMLQVFKAMKLPSAASAADAAVRSALAMLTKLELLDRNTRDASMKNRARSNLRLIQGASPFF